MMAGVPLLAPGGCTGSDFGSALRTWTRGQPSAMEPFGFTLGLVNRRRVRQKGDHPNERPHAGVRVAGD